MHFSNLVAVDVSESADSIKPPLSHTDFNNLGERNSISWRWDFKQTAWLPSSSTLPLIGLSSHQKGYHCVKPPRKAVRGHLFTHKTVGEIINSSGYL